MIILFINGNANGELNRLANKKTIKKNIEKLFKVNIIKINNLSDDELDRMTFCFIFQNGSWINKEYDTFEVMSHYDELAFGDFDNLKEK